METLAPDIQRSRAQLEDAARRIDVHRCGPDTHPEVAGAHAAIDWLLGRTDVAPVSALTRPVTGNLNDEAGRAIMAADEYGLDPGADPAVKLYAKAAEWVLYWAKDPAGQSPLPWWIRVTP